MLSHNNVGQNRYKKAVLSLLQQKYENYHIVFIDDMSDDGNMNKTIQLMQELKFSKERVRFIQNK